MATETRTCQNCKQEFRIEPDDFKFCEKINVPPPTFCFYCRIQRRMAFRNERMLYKRQCDAPGHTEQLISIFSPENKQIVFDHASWWGDSWDPTTYGQDVDFTRPFLTQVKELWAKVPDVALLNINPVNSEYCSITEGNKNCYLVFGGDFNENTLYSTYIFNSKECMDTYWVSKGELNYETVDCISCSKLQYSRYCEGCLDSAFLFDCKNCRNCLGCVGLRNKQYCIWNQQYSKEEYLQKLKEIDLSSSKKVEEIKARFKEHMLCYPHKYARILHAVNSSGDNLEGTKNCRQCFDVFGGGEDCAYVWLAYSKISDSMDVDRVGLNSELGYDTSTIYPGSRVFFSRMIFNSHDIYYSYNTHASAYLFGCVGVRNKQYCILNKQYSKEEWETMVPRLIKHLNDMPYRDSQGRIYKYGEFFPAELSPFAYNETIAQEMFPLGKEEAQQQGFAWRDPDEKKHIPTVKSESIPDNAKDIPNSIISEILECFHKGKCADQCTIAFKVMPEELSFYKRLNIPPPKLCPSCRHFARLKQRNPVRLWGRTCTCAGNSSSNEIYKNTAVHFHGDKVCPNKFSTTYAPARPEIVYCEECYNAEVV